MIKVLIKYVFDKCHLIKYCRMGFVSGYVFKIENQNKTKSSSEKGIIDFKSKLTKLSKNVRVL